MTKAKNKLNIPAHWPTQDQSAYWPIERFVPYERNARTHPAAQIAMLAELLKKFGPDQPIVVDENRVILKGHGRRLAAISAGLEVFTFVQRVGLSEDEKRALRIADNQVALLSGWDQQLIRTEIGSLKTSGYDLQLLGFPEAQLRGWGVGAGVATNNPEEIPDAPKRAVVRAGDLWELDKHRVLCGDATKSETWKRLFARQDRAAMVFTDPPYGVSYEGGSFEIIKGDDKRRDDLYKMLLQALREMTKHAADKAAFYIWHASSTREDFAEAVKAAGLTERQYLMWVKPAIFGRADYQWQHEPCFYASKADHAPQFYGERAESTVWHVQLASAKDIAATVGAGLLLLNGEGGTLYVQSKAPKNKKIRQIRLAKDSNVFLSGSDRQDGTVWEVSRDGAHEHPTQKPVELARRAIENSSRAGEIVVDGFLGSGTTLIGAEMTARRCFATELDPVYAEVAIRRWERFTNQKATLDGKTLEQVGRVRAAKPRLRRRGSPQDAPKAKGAAEIAAPSE